MFGNERHYSTVQGWNISNLATLLHSIGSPGEHCPRGSSKSCTVARVARLAGFTPDVLELFFVSFSSHTDTLSFPNAPIGGLGEPSLAALLALSSPSWEKERENSHFPCSCWRLHRPTDLQSVSSSAHQQLYRMLAVILSSLYPERNFSVSLHVIYFSYLLYTFDHVPDPAPPPTSYSTFPSCLK